MGISQETAVLGRDGKEYSKRDGKEYTTSFRQELKEQNTQASLNLITENQKVDSAVYSAGFVYIVLGERTVVILKSDTHLCGHVLKHGENKIKHKVQSFEFFRFPCHFHNSACLICYLHNLVLFHHYFLRVQYLYVQKMLLNITGAKDFVHMQIIQERVTLLLVLRC